MNVGIATQASSPENNTSSTQPNPRRSEDGARRKRLFLSLSLFWRTFFLLVLLLVGCMVAWLQTFRALEYEPRTIQTAHQIASLVNLTRAALAYSDAIMRVSLIKALAEQESVRIQPHEPGDRFLPYTDGALDKRVTKELTARLGKGTTVASQVNNEAGLWIGFTIENDSYWLLVDTTRFGNLDQRTLMIWTVTTMLLSLTGAALIARLINRPLKQLEQVTRQVREGKYDAHRLDERAHTNEIRAVNVGFNRMADRLTKIEKERALMLAGISHDLRTPLARLRLETELSVTDPDAHDHMAADIEQIDAIINKFLDYARPDHVELKSVLLRDVIDAATYVVQDYEDTQITIDVAADLRVMADAIELQRVISNLVENARRYGQTAATGVADITIDARARNGKVQIRVRDQGPGVAAPMLSQLSEPFFRGDLARSSAAGAGLGLSIVTRTIERMGGNFALTSTPGHGLSAHIELVRAAAKEKPAPKTAPATKD